MKRVLLAVLGFLGGFIFAWGVAMAVYVAGEGTGVFHDRDGGVAMGFAFSIGPFFGLIAGVIAAIWLSRRRARPSP